MRVLIIDAPIAGQTERRRTRWVPPGPAYPAAALRAAGHDVLLHNRLNMQIWHGLEPAELDRETERLIERAAPDLVGISGPTASFGDILAVAEIARRVRPEAGIVLGGPHASIVPVETLERVAAADRLVVGEGEERIMQLADRMPADTLPGIAWRSADGEVKLNPWVAPQTPLADLSPPALDRERVMRLLDLWRREGLAGRVQFAVQARGDGLDEEMLAAMKQAGCLHIELGMESGCSGRSRRRRQISTPSRPGIIQSSRAIEGASGPSSSAQASSPSQARTGSYPHFRTLTSRSRRFIVSSSATRILMTTPR